MRDRSNVASGICRRWDIVMVGRLGLVSATAAAAFSGLTATTSAVASADDADIALVMGGTGPCCVTSLTPPALPGPPYTTEVDQLFIAPHFPGYTTEGLPTPEQFAPFTGLTSEPLSTSVAQGLTDLQSAVAEQLGQGNHVVVFGYS
ncbi:PE-PPE domain-containing protein, partial [Mycobacterium sp.]|uniref:PE-PPE domain-containing protein n=1 Tax=Mycobacterium sp. TaxID=1785 RepID=UPI001273EB65